MIKSSVNGQTTLGQSLKDTRLNGYKKVSLKQTFSNIHNHLYANSNISRNERLGSEVIKIVLTKHFDEKWKTNIFNEKSYTNFGEQFPKKLKSFFNEKVLPILIEDNILTEKDELMIDDKSLIFLGLELSNIDFSSNPIDSLGAAFEVFAEGKLAGDQGQFFTPFFMVKLCVELLQPKSNYKILDPACGSGGFLNYTIRWLSKTDANLTKNFLENNLLGIDKDLDLAKIAKSFTLFMDGNPNNIYNLDSLKVLSDDLRLKENKFREDNLNKIDLILTNPPFGAKIKIKEEDILKYYDLGHVWKYNSTQNKFLKTRTIQETEPQILFIELCIKLLKNGGKMAMVLPEGIFGNPSQKFVRDYILSKGKILAIIDCPHDAFMPHTHTKTSILFFEKGEPKEDYDIFMGKVVNCGHDSRGTVLYDENGNIKEDFSEMIIKYEDYINSKLNENKTTFILNRKDLIDSVLLPNYYDFELLKHTKKNKNSDYEFISLGELEEKGHLSIKNVPSSISKEVYGSGNIPFIRTTDIANGEILYSSIHTISQEVFEQYKDKQGLKEHDILFVKDGTYRIGDSVLLFEKDLNCLVQSHFKMIRVLKHELINPFLLFFLLQQEIVQKQIKSNVFTQATLSSIGNRIYDIKIPLPKNKKEKDQISNLAKEALSLRNKYKHELFDFKIKL
ncbi:MAG: N-6 DNA methylase [Candidatus Nanoarchaeia archaeon]|nr:N-6 DNA methylase [Candidatus Nanoarchaeia archaeon]